MGVVPGFAFLDQPPGPRMLALGRRAEELGYGSLWVSETRLTRDAISLMGALAASTERIRLGTSIVNTWTRGPVLMALTFATLHELAPGRLALGLGAYSDPLALNQGVVRRRPLTQMREYVSVVRRLFAMESDVTLEGELVRVSDITLDLTRGASRSPLAIPILIGATGERMARLAGEIADGVVFNGFLPPSYTRTTAAGVREAAAAAGRDPDVLELPQLVAVAMSDDGDEARAVAHRFGTMYLGGQPHIARVVGLDPELTARLGELVGSWPPRPGGVERAMELLSPSVSMSLVVAGTASECRSRLGEWVKAGASYPIVTPLTENPEEICEALAPGVG